MNAEPTPPDLLLPCGCVVKCSIENGERVMTMIACRAGCDYLAFAISEADRQSKPVEVVEK